MPTLTTHCLVIPRWRPATTNELMSGRTWHKAARLKKRDREMVAAYARLADIPPAGRTRRRVDVLVRNPKGERRKDPDAFWKSLLDALVQAELLADDSERWCVLGAVVQTLDGKARTEITLTDLEG